MPTKSKRTKRNKTIKPRAGTKQRGGLPPGSTDGSLVSLVYDIVGVVESIFDTISYSAETILDVVELPGDMGKAFTDPGAPRPSDIP